MIFYIYPLLFVLIFNCTAINRNKMKSSRKLAGEKKGKKKKKKTEPGAVLRMRKA